MNRFHAVLSLISMKTILIPNLTQLTRIVLGYTGAPGHIIYDDKAGDFATYPGYHIVLLDELARRE